MKTKKKAFRRILEIAFPLIALVAGSINNLLGSVGGTGATITASTCSSSGTITSYHACDGGSTNANYLYACPKDFVSGTAGYFGWICSGGTSVSATGSVNIINDSDGTVSQTPGGDGINFSIYNATEGSVTIISTVTGNCPGDDCTATPPPSPKTFTATLIVQFTPDCKGGCSSSCSSPLSPPSPTGVVSYVAKAALTTAAPISSIFNGVDFQMNLGLANQQRKAGILQVRGTAPTNGLVNPTFLSLPYDRPNVQKVFNPTNGQLAQVYTPQGLINVCAISDYEYHLDAFYGSNVTAMGTNWCYGTNYAPFATWIVQNPDEAGASNRVFITENRGGEERQFQYTYNSTNSEWDLLMPDGTTVVSTWFVPVTGDSTSTNYFYQVSSGGQILTKSQKTYKYISGINSRLLTQDIEGDGTVTATTIYTYYSDNATNGASTNLIRRIDYPEGNWVYYTYDSLGRKLKEYAAYNNSAPPTDVTTEPSDVSTYQCKLTQYSYSLTNSGDGIDFAGDPAYPQAPCKTTVSIPAFASSTWALHEVSRTYSISDRISGTQEQQICPNPGVLWNDSANLITITLWSTNQDFTQGLPLSVSHPDGTVTLHTYSMSSSNMITTEQVGQADNWETPTAIEEGTQTITIVDALGQFLSSTANPISGATVSSIVQVRDMYHYTDTLKRSYIVTNLAGLTTQYSYSDCCGLNYIVDQEGTTNWFLYDSLKRPLGSYSLGITNDSVLDGVGRVVQTQRIGTDGSIITNSQTQYDVLGRVVRQTNAFGGVTTISNVVSSSQLFQTNIYPDGGTKISSYNRDGQPAGISGTASAPMQFLYGAEQDGSSGPWRQYAQTIKVSASGGTNEWTKTYYDGAGHACKTIYAGASTNPFSVVNFDNLGHATNQIDPDGVSTIYLYNGKGEPTHTVVDMNQDGHVDWSGPDRITLSTNDVLYDNGANMNRRRLFVWSTNSATPLLISTTETSVDGLTNVSIEWNNGNAISSTNVVNVNPAYGYRITTSYGPDGSYSVTTNQYGRLISAARYDATGGRVIQTTYGYDVLGRQNTITDARTGTTTYYFNNADQVSGTSAPLSQVTSNYFDTSGRQWKIVLPDGTSQTNEFYNLGQIKRSYGSRTYPVGYGYDAQGRMTTMSNWTSFASGAGLRVTSWNYDAYRGFNTNKVHAGSNGPGYSYTAAGRLASRCWARGTITSYSYNGAGDTVSTTYNDGTTLGTTNGFDREGRIISITNGYVVVTLGYNDHNQILSEYYSGGPLDEILITNAYDKFLRPVQNAIINSTTTLAMTTNGYDAASRLSIVSDETNSATYSYLSNSLLISNILFARSGVTQMTTTKYFDNLNRLTSIINSNASTVLDVFGCAYDLNGQRIAVTNTDNTCWKYQYDSLGQVVSGIKYWSDGSIVAGQQFGYLFDDIGNRISATSGGDEWGKHTREADYTVNSLNQYALRTVPGAADIIGSATNTATVTVNGQPAYRHRSYYRAQLMLPNESAAVWQPVTNLAVLNQGTNADITATNVGNIFLPENNELFTYDADGNLTQDGRWIYQWDGENRLINMTSRTNGPSGSKIKLDFAYDYRSRRIEKLVSMWVGSAYLPQSTNRFAYDEWNLRVITDGQGIAESSFMWGSDLSGSAQGAGGIGGLLTFTQYAPTNAQGFIAFDCNGNVVGLIDTLSSAITAEYEYGPFGEPIKATGSIATANPFRFSTKQQDGESDLLYYGYRYCVTSEGRWINRDPVGERGGINLYSFVKNDPLNQYDKLGQCIACQCLQAFFLKPNTALGYELTGSPPTGANIGVPVPYYIHVAGDPTKCKCRYLDYGTLTASGSYANGQPLTINKVWNADVNPADVHDVPCEPGIDQPGWQIGFPPNLGFSLTVTSVKYAWTGVVECYSAGSTTFPLSDTASINATYAPSTPITWRPKGWTPPGGSPTAPGSPAPVNQN